MTTLPQDDEVDASVVEDTVARLEVVPDPPAGGVRHLAAVPETAPVADDERARAPEPRPRLRLVPAPTPLRAVPAPAPATPPLLRVRARRSSAPDGWHVVGGEDRDDERGAAPVTDAGRFAHGVGLACVEVVLGRRPAAQLARWVAPHVLDSLQESADLVRRAGVLTHARRPAARRVRVCPVDRHTAEVCLVVDDGVRVRAVALRLEAHRGAWRVTTLEIG
ncbi:hypothetical protein Cfla_2324 [Cellulomonas flavigena DSM 20109]|uniref:Uncharacterized protein n=1 Tax=Cellulomonas flavigena (strain ATCC 482 / DSM 20109 / BCRC 11376 / JCM 18109 / NBRC 3775 / NCIMB 8073 / NRS 134) TaxID=446466 RepID=D5UGW6_CELFN|nr:Rv3235 family protein [Cellulomonas flavigena]ADG75214.1 hypothetical protein Cfla_2324 [Cellulomonas flavigena DSM 20109]